MFYYMTGNRIEKRPGDYMKFNNLSWFLDNDDETNWNDYPHEDNTIDK